MWLMYCFSCTKYRSLRLASRLCLLFSREFHHTPEILRTALFFLIYSPFKVTEFLLHRCEQHMRFFCSYSWVWTSEYIWCLPRNSSSSSSVTGAEEVSDCWPDRDVSNYGEFPICLFGFSSITTFYNASKLHRLPELYQSSVHWGMFI